MRLTVIGCSGGFATAESAASGYLVEHDGARLMLDLGNGTLGALQRYLDLTADDALSGLVLSHCHIDHCADVGTLFVHRHYRRPRRPASRLPILGPAEARMRLAQIYGMPDPHPLDEEFTFEALGGEPVRIGPFTVESVPAAHPVEAYCVRVSAGGRSITYSGDTGPEAALAGLAQGTDIALFEASLTATDARPNLHLTAAQAGRIAREAGARSLVLTHHVLWNDRAEFLAEARREYSGPITQAAPGLTVDAA